MNEIDNLVISDVLSKPNNLNSIVEDAFSVADKNRNGTIDLEEFGICMNNFSESFRLSNPDKKSIELEFERFDLHKNGIIDFEKLKRFVKEIINRMLFT